MAEKFDERRKKRRHISLFRRKRQRIMSSIPVILKPTEQEKAKIIKATAVNISHTGLSLIVDRSLPNMDHLIVQLKTKPDQAVKDITAKIVWEKRKSNGSKFKYGISFANLEKTQEEKVENIIKDILNTTEEQQITIFNKLEDFIYKNVIRRIMLTSKLGHSSVMGKANTGINFDHMYSNDPQGKLVIGKMVDKVLLNLPAVEATRYRKENIKKILINEIENNDLLNRKTKVLDLCSGPARYIIETLTNSDIKNLEAVCLDSDSNSIEYGKMLHEGHPVRFVKADLFKLRHLKSFAKKKKWNPNIVIASGVMEYFDDGTVLKILKDIYAALANEGIFIFATQYTNPSRKLMEKVCVTTLGDNWYLYYRSMRQIRKWMIDTGFKSVVVSIDPWNMYEMCTGRKYKG
ncbi:MAG: class I SAM-dependent methyltransferase family protein, partial [bacterium]